MPGTLFDHIWDRHAILTRPDGVTLLHAARHYVHDISSNAFSAVAARGLTVRRPDRTFGMPDHYVSTVAAIPGKRTLDDIKVPEWRNMVVALSRNAAANGFTLFDDERQGIVHIVGPEQGLTQPGLLILCEDSHTATHGALGALAFGIGSSEVAQVLATQALWQIKPKAMRITIGGMLAPGVTAKDLILAIIARIGAGGGSGHVIEYAGSTIRALSVEGRMTVCNMTIEAGARAGMVAPDDTTYAYLQGRRYAPKGEMWDRATAYWRTLPSAPDAVFDTEVSIDAADIAPMVTWGTSPEDALPVSGRVPDPADVPGGERREAMIRKLDYMGLTPGTAIGDIAVDQVFIGSCTNGRIEDLRAAASVARGRKAIVPTIVVPGSGLVREAAEAEGLDDVFRAAGFEWRYAGCSMCVAVNGDRVPAGNRCASTSNRNFVGRQGRGARTHLVSPAMAAAAAVTGRFTDIRQLMGS